MSVRVKNERVWGFPVELSCRDAERIDAAFGA